MRRNCVTSLSNKDFTSQPSRSFSVESFSETIPHPSVTFNNNSLCYFYYSVAFGIGFRF